MRLLFYNFTINYGGGPQYVVHLAKLLSLNHEVHIVDAYGFCVPYLEAIRQAGVTVHILCPGESNVFIGGGGLRRCFNAARQLPQFLTLRKKLRHLFDQIQPDAAWAVNEKSLTFLALSQTRRAIPLFLFVIGWSKADTVSWWLRYLMRKKTAGVVAVSKATMDELRKLSIPDSKLHLGLMTVEFDEIRQLAQVPLDNPPSGDRYPRILMLAARPTYEKGLHVAYDAVGRLKQRGYNPALWITGAMPTGSTNRYIQFLQDKASQLNIEENVFFLGWQSNLPAVIQACNMGILPSYTEGFPRIILETMLLKKPVIATPVGGVCESVINFQTGLTIAVGDDSDLADKIELLIKQPDLQKKLTDRAFEFIYLNFSPEKHLQKIEQIFAEAVQNDFDY